MKKTPYDIITEKVIEMLEQGTIPWKRPWKVTNRQATSVATKKGYRGMNWLLLNSIMVTEGYKRPEFLTYKKAAEMGGNVIKGQRGWPVTLWQWFDKKEGGKVVYGPNGKPQQIPFLRYYTVFNADQVEGIEWPELGDDKQIDFTPLEHAQVLIDEWEECPVIEHTGVRACYSRQDDKVLMPEANTFKTSEAYYATLFHELGHSTGHTDRLNREFGKRFGDKAYAYEELVAEMTSAFLCAESGIVDDTLEDTAAYIKSWIKKLKDDPKMVVTAAGAAQKSADMILGTVPEYAANKDKQDEEAA